MPAPSSEGVMASAHGISAPLKWLGEHIRSSLSADEDTLKQLFSLDSRYAVCDLCMRPGNSCNVSFYI